jgi:hypothetical protein
MLWCGDLGATPLDAAVEVERTALAGDCPGREELSAAVERILERPIHETETSEGVVRVIVQFKKEASKYQAHLQLRGSKSGERTLTDSSDDCQPLAEAVSVAMALFLDQELPEVPEKIPPEPAVERTAPERPLALRAAFGTGIAAGLGSGLSPVFEVELSLAVGGFLLETGLGGTATTSQELEPGRVRTQLVFASVRGCYLFGDLWRFGPCAAFGMGSLRGRGIGYEANASQSLWWTALGPGLVLQRRLGPSSSRIFGGARGDLWIPTQSQSFRVDNVGAAWESPAVQGAVLGFVGVRLW